MALNALRGPRLELVPACPSHLDFFSTLNSDADVMWNISGRPSSRSETEAEWSRRLGRRSAEDRGLGYWTGLLDAQPIGWWGLGFNEPNPGEGELGFRVQREHWRQGLALEGSRLLVEHGFTATAVTRIWAGTVTSNTASRATLSRLGMECIDEPLPGVLTYELTLDTWLARRRVSGHTGIVCRVTGPGRSSSA